jgi:alcohol dehydrogenase
MSDYGKYPLMQNSLPKQMKAVLLTGHGGLDKLVYVDDYLVPHPGAGEVVIEVAACGMNNTDVWVREAAYGTEDDPNARSSWRRGRNTLTFPRIQGCDTVGYIAAVGEGVPASRIGERVMVDFSIYNAADDYLGDIDYMGHGRDGGYAEFMALPAENAHPIHSDLTDIELATFCCAYLTAEHMLDRARLSSGERILVTGASGGVGSAIIQLAHLRGAEPVAIVGPGKEQAVKEVGALQAFDRTDSALFDLLYEATSGELFHVAADLVGGSLFNLCLKALRPHGRYTTAGAIGGPVVQFDLRTMYLKHLELHGSSQGTRVAFRRLHNYIEAGALKPLVAGVYRLSAFHEAQRAFMAKKFVGKLVVVPDRHW